MNPPVLFDHGRTVITRAALETLTHVGGHVPAAIRGLAYLMILRHVTGDWGNVPPEDALLNRRAVGTSQRIFSSYQFQNDGDSVTFWVITEWDRSVTTILLPEDY